MSGDLRQGAEGPRSGPAQPAEPPQHPVTDPQGRAGAPTWTTPRLGSTLGLRLFLALLRVVGRWPLYLLMVPTSAWYLVVARDQRRGLDPYLRRRFGPLGWARRLAHTWAIFLLQALGIVDRFVLLVRGPGSFRFTREGTDGVRAHLASGRGLVLLTGHVGNPDLAAAALRGTLDGVRVAVLRRTVAGDPTQALLAQLAGSNAPRVIELDDAEDLAGLQVLRALREGEVVVVQADRVVDGRSAPVELLGGVARLPTGPYLLAALSGVPVAAVTCVRTGPASYHLAAFGPEPVQFASRRERERALAGQAQAYARHLEAIVRRHPHQWFNFHDLWDAPGSERT